jgi:hypothetical protein
MLRVINADFFFQKKKKKKHVTSRGVAVCDEQEQAGRVCNTVICSGCSLLLTHCPTSLTVPTIWMRQTIAPMTRSLGTELQRPRSTLASLHLGPPNLKKSAAAMDPNGGVCAITRRAEDNLNDSCHVIPRHWDSQVTVSSFRVYLSAYLHLDFSWTCRNLQWQKLCRYWGDTPSVHGDVPENVIICKSTIRCVILGQQRFRSSRTTALTKTVLASNCLFSFRSSVGSLTALIQMPQILLWMATAKMVPPPSCGPCQCHYRLHTLLTRSVLNRRKSKNG